MPKRDGSQLMAELTQADLELVSREINTLSSKVLVLARAQANLQTLFDQASFRFRRFRFQNFLNFN